MPPFRMSQDIRECWEEKFKDDFLQKLYLDLVNKNGSLLDLIAAKATIHATNSSQAIYMTTA